MVEQVDTTDFGFKMLKIIKNIYSNLENDSTF